MWCRFRRERPRPSSRVRADVDAGDKLDEEEEPDRAAAVRTRVLGLVVCRGTHILAVCPQHGMAPIANPFDDPVDTADDAVADADAGNGTSAPADTDS